MKKNNKPTVVGIVAEYNPFHNGHLYHLNQSKELSGADYCVAVMSGDFVQRGSPAIFDKYVRTAMALEAGIDLVLEIPCAFATGSAEDFASGSIALLHKLGVVDSVCFGSECGSVEPLMNTARILAAEPTAYQIQLKAFLKTGMTFPLARKKALEALGTFYSEEDGFLSSPNNILGIEYCKALLRQNSSIQPLTITRAGSGYHDQSFSHEYCSASAIRQELSHSSRKNRILETCQFATEQSLEYCQFADQVPPQILSLILEGRPLYTDDFTALLHAALLRLNQEQIPFSSYADVSEELSARIHASLLTFSPFDEKVKQLKTKQYTYTRISRALLHILLGLTKEHMTAYRIDGCVPYARVLGFRKTSAPLLTEIKKRGQIPLITKTADAASFLTGTARELFLQDLTCSHIYQCVTESKYHTTLKNEFTNSVVIR